MTMWRTISLILPLLGMLNSCSTVQQRAESTEREKDAQEVKIPPPLHLGAVHQVIPEKSFALLRIIGPMPKEGTVLISHPADGASDRVGNLQVSGGQHRRGNIIVADIRSGTVIKGDRVFLYRSIAENSREEEIPEEDSTVTDASDTLADNGDEEQIPDFSTTAAVSDMGLSPFAQPTRTEAISPFADNRKSETETEQPEAPEPPTDVPDKLLDIPDTLDGWE